MDSHQRKQHDTKYGICRRTLVEYIDPSHDNTERMALIYCLIGNLQARNKLLEMQRGYMVESDDRIKCFMQVSQRIGKNIY